MLDPLSIIAIVIKKEVPRLTLPEASHVAWEVLVAIKELSAVNETEGKKE